MMCKEKCEYCGTQLEVYTISYYPSIHGTRCPKRCHEIRKRQTRRDLRGTKLLDFCHKAKISKHELGQNDNRQFCYGMIDRKTDELLSQCYICKANVIYASEVLDKDE